MKKYDYLLICVDKQMVLIDPQFCRLVIYVNASTEQEPKTRSPDSSCLAPG